MTKSVNEQIAEVMGWAHDSHEYQILIDLENHPFCNQYAIIKLLQAKMVEDGWEIKIFNATGVCQALARRPGENDYKMQSNPMGEDEEPATIFALFCKVYNIG